MKKIKIRVNHFTPEEMEEIDKKRYRESKENLENMSYWFPKIDSSKTKENSILRLPKTKVVPLSYEQWKWIQSGSYKEEEIKKFNDYLVKELGTFEEGKTLFMKTGIFSDKFYFKVTVVDGRETIGDQFLNMYYASMMLGADKTAEVVFREMIKDAENRHTIYEGMPLHTEFRIFYDFNEKKTIGTSNYWHPDVMEKHIKNEDADNYAIEKQNIVRDYEQYKLEISKEVEKFMDGVEGLSGKWSIDVMKNGNEFWIIDMARMEKSALVSQMEAL